MVEVTSEGFKVSKYNSAQLLNVSLDKLWNDARNHARSGQYDSWKYDLDMIWNELGADTPEGGADEKLFEKFSEDISKTGRLEKPQVNGFKNLDSKDKARKSIQYLKLRKLHLWLKRLQNRLGKGTAYKDEFEDDFE